MIRIGTSVLTQDNLPSTRTLTLTTFAKSLLPYRVTFYRF